MEPNSSNLMKLSTQSDADSAILKYIAHGMRPLNTVCDPSFQNMVRGMFCIYSINQFICAVAILVVSDMDKI